MSRSRRQFIKNNAEPPAGIRYTHPRGCVFSFCFKRIITGKAPWLPLGGSWLGSKAAQTEGVTPTAPAGHLPPRGRQVTHASATPQALRASSPYTGAPQSLAQGGYASARAPHLLYSEIRCKRRHCVMPFAPLFAAHAAFGGERVRYADSPCGASAYARTKKLPFQRQFRDRGGTLPWCRRDSEPPRAILLRNSGGEENRAQKCERLRGFPEIHDFFFHQFERKSVNMVNGGRVCEPRPPPRYFYGCGYRSITYSIIAHRGRLVKSLEAIRNRRRRRPRPRRPRRRPKENRFRRP